MSHPRLELKRTLSRIFIGDRLWIRSIYKSTALAIEIDGITEKPSVCTIEDFDKLHSAVASKIMPAGVGNVILMLINKILTEKLASINDNRVTCSVRNTIVNTLRDAANSGLGSDE